MKAFSITRKTLLELWREPLLLGLLLLFPVALVGFYYVAFGQTEEGLATYLSILVVNDDAGVASGSAPDGWWQAGADLIDVLCQTEWEGDPIFEVEVVNDHHAAQIALRERKVALLLVIPADFTQALLEAASGGAGMSPAKVSLVGDPNSETFVFAQSFLNSLLREFIHQVVGWQDKVPPVNYEFLPGTGTMSDFDFGVGGIIIFGITFLMISTATVMVRENVTGTLSRFQLNCVGAGSLLFGVTLAQMGAAAIQVPITFGTAMAMGFRNNGSLLLAMGIGLLVALSAVGVGLIVACFARNDGEATNLASVALVPMAFLSGALFPMPAVPLFTVGERTVELYDLLPTTHAAVAMRRVLIFGEGPGTIIYELVMMTVLSIAFLVVGVVLYQRLRMKRI
jgi:ABC-2 type transport system permease protein